MNSISPYAKAIAAFVGAAVVAYLGVQEGGVTSAEWIKVLLAGLGGSGLIYVVPNRDPRGLKQDESVQPPSRGAVDTLLPLVLATFVLVLLLFLGVHAR